MEKTLSIIIPVFQESAVISNTVQGIAGLKIPLGFEIIISDGEACQSTLAHLRQNPAGWGCLPLKLIGALPGRGPQLNAGARAAQGDLFLFLHADTRLDQKGLDLMIQTWQDQEETFFCGAFDLSIDSEKKIFRLIERISSLRSRLFKIPYGDQGIFMSRQLFERVGGFPPTPIMEDVGIMSKIKKAAIAPRFLDHAITTSARRWEEQGVLYTTLRNWGLILLYRLGISPRRLARYY